MIRHIFLAAIATFFACIAFASPANAQATRTWVSGVGDDANPCSRTAPCKTFAGAISKTAIGGEISCLDPGGFGAVTITKSLTIDCVGTNGSILAANSNGILVNGAGAIVTLRNIQINGASTTTGIAIRILQAGTVNIDRVVIENFGGSGAQGIGISIETSTANARVNIQNSSFFNINNFSVFSNPTAGNVILSASNVISSRGGTTAFQLHQLTSAFLDHVTVTQHAAGAALTTDLSTNTTHISNSFFANNNFGIFSGNAGGLPTTRLYETVITGSATDAIHINSGSVFSYGNNAIRGNNGNEAPTGAATGTQ